MWLTALCVLALAYGGGGVTKQSGITKFWTDDYKVFDQVYGKTSDKDLYGVSLPSSGVGYGVDKSKKKALASEKNERVLLNGDISELETVLADRYAKLYTAQTLDNYEKVFQPTSSYNFVSYSDFKPISQQNDPETYDYLKHLEQQQLLDKEQSIEFPKGIGGFKPYLSVLGKNTEDTKAFKSIQDILDAHEANKPKNKPVVEEDDDVKYLNYGRPTERIKTKPKPREKSKPRQIQNNYISNNRCRSGRCRKRAINTGRIRSRPYIRKIQRIVY